jgi:hypothetical protein
MTNIGGDMHTITLEKGLAAFLDGLAGKNRSGGSSRRGTKNGGKR